MENGSYIYQYRGVTFKIALSSSTIDVKAKYKKNNKSFSQKLYLGINYECIDIDDFYGNIEKNCGIGTSIFNIATELLKDNFPPNYKIYGRLSSVGYEGMENHLLRTHFWKSFGFKIDDENNQFSHISTTIGGLTPKQQSRSIGHTIREIPLTLPLSKFKKESEFNHIDDLIDFKTFPTITNLKKVEECLTKIQEIETSEEKLFFLILNKIRGISSSPYYSRISSVRDEYIRELGSWMLFRPCFKETFSVIKREFFPNIRTNFIENTQHLRLSEIPELISEIKEVKTHIDKILNL
ncbi:MAG: hypothetical protein JXR16_02015 [Bermanella sp.]